MYVISINPWNEKPLLVYRIPMICNKNLTHIVLLAKSSMYYAYIVNKQDNPEYIWKIKKCHFSVNINKENNMLSKHILIRE